MRISVIGRQLPKVVTNSLGTMAAAAASLAALFVSGVLAARLLGPTDRGHFALFALIPGVLALIVLFGSSSALTVYIARFPDQSYSILRTMIRIGAGQVVACVGINILVNWIVIDHQYHDAVLSGWVSIIAGPAIIVQYYGLGILQGLQRFREFNIVRLFPGVGYSLLLVLAALLGNVGLVTTVVVWTISGLIAAAVMCVTCLRVLPKTLQDVSPVSSSEITRFAVKGFLGTATPLETFRIDQFAVGWQLGPAALGIYAVAGSLMSLPRFLSQSLSVVALPFIASQADARLAQRTMWRFLGLALLGMIGVTGLLFVVVDPFIPMAFGPEFKDAIGTTRILLVAAVLFGAKGILSECLRGMGMAMPGTAAEVCSWLVLIPAILLVVPKHGIDGMAVALVLSAGTSLALVTLFALISPVVANTRTRKEATSSKNGIGSGVEVAMTVPDGS